MDNDIVISVQNVSKNFKLPHEKADSVKSVFVNPFDKKRKKFEIQHALRDISFDIKKGEFFGIVGRNGSGKSTLLKVIAGIYQPNAGSVTINGRLVPFIELGVGFNPELSGRENVYLNGALMGFSEKEVSEKLKEIVEFAELERFMDQKLKNYSSGMQVRLAFSVATILAESDILLIDEVLAVGDADFQRKCFEYFRQLKKNNKTVIFVSHDMNAIREYCDRAVLIEKSEVVFEGSSDRTAKEYTRLFMPDLYKAQEQREKQNKQKEVTSGKWGHGGVDMQKLTVSNKVVKEDDPAVTFRVDIKLGRDFPAGIMPGFVIKDEQGRAICGTNSKILKYGKQRSLKAGEKVIAQWEVSNIFSEGMYVIEPAVNDPDTSELCQWWDEAGTFRVVNEKSTPYPVTPKIDLRIGE